MKTDLYTTGESAANMRFAIVAARWHGEMTERLTLGARRAFAERDAGPVETIQVPGAFELPIAARVAAMSGRVDAVIALGVVIRGDTPHFDHVAGQAASGLMSIALSTGVPVLFGVITADTVEQAEIRSADNDDNKGYEAAIAAIELVAELRRFGSSDPKVVAA